MTFVSLSEVRHTSYQLAYTDRADSVRCAMVVERCLLQHNVARTLAAALMTSYVVSVVQALKSTYSCGVGEFYDEVFEECRNCRLLCDPVYRTFQQCADKCPGSVAGVQTTATSSERLTDGAVSSEEKTSSTRVVLAVLAACAVFVMLFTTTIAIVLLRRLKRRGIDPEMVTMMHPEHTNGEATSSQFSPSPVGKLPYAEYTNS